MLPQAHPARLLSGTKVSEGIADEADMYTATVSLSYRLFHLPGGMNIGGSAVRALPKLGSLERVEGRLGQSGALMGTSAATDRLKLQVRRMGPHFRTALITGERGVRKEEVARSLHAASSAARKPFVTCDAARLEEHLSSGGDQGVALKEESVEDLLREAQGGTIFIRELGQFSTAAQEKLLRLLEAIDSAGGERIRIIVSVSGEVQTMVAAGILQPELLARVGTIELAVAPLRDRLEDIEVIAARILAETSLNGGAAAKTIAEAALKELQARNWPGNERELESLLRMSMLASGGAQIDVQHLSAANKSSDFRMLEVGPVPSMKLQDVVEAHVQEVLRICDGNKVKAAEVLGISRSTLYRMLEAVSSTGASK